MSNSPEQLTCPQCQESFRTIKTLGVADSASLKCPKCGYQAALGDFRRAEAFLRLNGNGSCTPPPLPPPIQESPEPQGFDSEAVRRHPDSYLPRRRRGRGVLGEVVHFLDFGFTRYLTPTILKLTWILAIAFIVLGFTFELLSAAGAFTSDVADEFSIRFPDLGLGGGDGGSTRDRDTSELAESAERSATRAAGYIVKLCIKLLASVLFLLWVRVALEAGIVIFQLAGDVKAIRGRVNEA